MIDQRKARVMMICRKKKVSVKTDQKKRRNDGFDSGERRLGEDGLTQKEEKGEDGALNWPGTSIK